MAKILLMNIPSGPYPSETLPVGISRVMEGLNSSLDCRIKFIDMDYRRLSFTEMKKEIAEFSPDIIGISAVLTHAYAYIKKLSLFLKDEFPDTVQVLGGEMASISNIVIQKTKIQYCVAGESEPAFSALIKRLSDHNFKPSGKMDLSDIKGLVYLKDGAPFFTGYAEKTDNELRQMNYALFESFTDINHYFPLIKSEHFRRGLNKNEVEVFFNLLKPENRDKRIAQVYSSKGCVGRCTFCHRFFKGYRTIDPDSVIKHIDELTAKYGIGLIKFADENFGSDKKGTEKIIEHLKNKGLNWVAGAARVDNVDENTIKRWKECGCVSAGFGFESCSQKILDIMEKRTTVEQNLNTLRWCSKYGILAGLLILVGMPGETDETIDETIDNLAKVIPDDIDMPYEAVINYFQAVPGTPGYEYARGIGLIGPSVDEEEKYLESLYEVNANDIRHYLNFTDYHKEEVVYWKHYIFLELIVAYIQKHGLLKTLKHKKANRYRYAAVYMLLPRPVRKLLLKYLSILFAFGLLETLKIVYKCIFIRRKMRFGQIHGSLRKLIKEMPLAVRPDDIFTNVLRDGR